MKITAIISEYNPLTNGHVKHMQIAKEETNCDCIMCIMSGSFVQRGEPAILDKYLRAQSAVKNGADIVIELPTIYSISPADNFAYGAIKMISAIPHIKYISFGSECGDINLLEEVASILYDEPTEYKDFLQNLLRNGILFPKAREEALTHYIKAKKMNLELLNVIASPNNILGIAYINAAKKEKLDIKFHTIKRSGSEYNSENLEDESPSAMAIRKALQKENREEIKESVPKDMWETLIHYRPREFTLGDMILFKLRNIDNKELEQYYDVSGGIHNRLQFAALTSNSYEEMLEKAKSKNITMARLKRISLYALFGITQQMYNSIVTAAPYYQILAINGNEKDNLLSLLSMYTKNLLTRYSDVNRIDKSLRPFIKLDFTAQGTLSIANKSNYTNRKMIII